MMMVKEMKTIICHHLIKDREPVYQMTLKCSENVQKKVQMAAEPKPLLNCLVLYENM